MSTNVGEDLNEKTYCECKTATNPQYKKVGFFGPRLRSINHLSVGRSRIVENPLTIALELLYRLYILLRERWRSLMKHWFPKDMDAAVVPDATDSDIVGKLVFAAENDVNQPIHNMHLVFWARTWTLQWRKLAEGFTDANGDFKLRYALRAARNWRVMQRRLEIYQTDHRYQDSHEPKPHYQLFKAIKIAGTELTGLRYSLRTIQLFFWEYRTDSPVPRVVIRDHDRDSPEHYVQARTDAMSEQLIPIELTKWKHLKQLKDDPGSLTMQQIQADYPGNLTQCMEKAQPGITRSDRWFGERMLNGMNAVTLEAAAEGGFWTHFFGVCDYEHNDEYAFPTSRVRFVQDPAGNLQPVEISLVGRLTAADDDDKQVRNFTPADGDKWLQAKRVTRVTAALSAELDDHFAGTHLLTEQFSIAAHRNLRHNPIAALLMPHLKEVVLINRTADTILVGPRKPPPAPGPILSGGFIRWLQNKIENASQRLLFETGGYIPQASALTAKGINQRAYDMLGVQDWHDWRPMKPIGDNHYFAHSQQAYWDMLQEYVSQFFDQNEAGIREHWLEVYRFSEDLVNHSVEAFRPDGRALGEERLQWYQRRYHFDPNADRRSMQDPDPQTGEARKHVISPITESEVAKDPADMERLKQACAYLIMQSTFVHSFVNEHQYADIGEVLYSCLGLRFGDGVDGIMTDESDLRVAPSLERATQMMWFSNLLSRTEYGFIENNEEGDINPRMVEMLKQHQEQIEQAGHGMLISNIESRTNI